MRLQLCAAAFLLLLACIGINSSLVSAQPAAGLPGTDFEAELVKEAVDLSAANSEGLPDDQQEMESLLHWAIGEFK
jgi:hypothetical protein